ncbi:MAG: hydroxyethylthiazole kinase, partial [Odoribacter sp.]|nr:hydroxyethylthiazole kinase [Odoribacter sp.]
ITNYVVMNNTANALLAVGASPVMAHAEEEVEDMVKIASALVINMGTLDPKWTKSMILAGKAANKKGIPLIFDPVGAGATPYRSNVCQEIIQACKPTVIRGNASEIISLNNNNSQTKGVDSTASSDSALDSAKSLALSVGCVVVISGETDYITDSTNVMTVKNGNTMMAKVTGMGCTATAVVGAFCAVNKDALQGALHGMSVMGIAGEIAAMKSRGNGSLQMNFLDELYNLDEDTIRKHIKI